ncbi:hypothetical protein BC830DRAFT_1119588 [Chytriomyces sp. MP71]|nr:hypothetical protein BC830DRAFT_1119588 [Chytriomyces sp. MP71]
MISSSTRRGRRSTPCGCVLRRGLFLFVLNFLVRTMSKTIFVFRVAHFRMRSSRCHHHFQPELIRFIFLRQHLRRGLESRHVYPLASSPVSPAEAGFWLLQARPPVP